MKVRFLIILLVLMVCLTSCKAHHYEIKEYKVVEKYTAVDGDIFSVHTKYYLILSNGQTVCVSQRDYGKYLVGDNYTIEVLVEGRGEE